MTAKSYRGKLFKHSGRHPPVHTILHGETLLIANVAATRWPWLASWPHFHSVRLTEFCITNFRPDPELLCKDPFTMPSFTICNQKFPQDDLMTQRALGHWGITAFGVFWPEP